MYRSWADKQEEKLQKRFANRLNHVGQQLRSNLPPENLKGDNRRRDPHAKDQDHGKDQKDDKPPWKLVALRFKHEPPDRLIVAS